MMFSFLFQEHFGSVQYKLAQLAFRILPNRLILHRFLFICGLPGCHPDFEKEDHHSVKTNSRNKGK